MPEIPAPARRPLRFSSFELDLQSGELRKAGVLVRLQEQSLKVLTKLLERPGDLVTREQLRQRLWPNGKIFLDPTLAAACGNYEGHLLTGEVAGPLPFGASLDARLGIFRWQPGSEVSGTFSFVFAQRGCDAVERRIPLRIDIADPA